MNLPSATRLFGSPEPLLFGLTPPRLTTPPDQLAVAVDRTSERIAKLSVDALALYDIDDESARNPAERPFPFVETIDPGVYLRDHLTSWTGRAIVYRSVGKYTPQQLAQWMREAPDSVLSVFVGASTGDQQVATTLPQAHQLHREVRPSLPLGGVTLPERHRRKGDEPQRIVAKQQAGVEFFVSQVVYDVGTAKDLASDYAFYCAEQLIEPAPILFTLSVCGSEKTLEFLAWLGVDVPRWLRNVLVHSDDMLEMSANLARSIAVELADFCRYLHLPFGFNVESVSSRRVEIDAAVELTHFVGEEVLRRDA